MRVLYMSTAFPKEGSSSTIYTDLSDALVQRGHRVTVLSAEEKKNATTTVINQERGCTVIRAIIGNMYDVGLFEKGITIVTLEKKLKKAMVKYLKNKQFDLILFGAPPSTLAGVVKLAKKMFNAPAFLMMKDIFPQNAVDINIMKKNSFVYHYFRYKEKKLYCIADEIGCMSLENMQYIYTHSNVEKGKLSIFPNTKYISNICNDKDVCLREKYGIPKDKTVFVFGGNMGKPQGLQFLCDAIRALENYESAFFLLIGRGTEKKMVKSSLNECDNVRILDNLPREDYEALVKECDVGIVSLDYRFTIPNYPSRVLTYMEFSMPIIAATDVNTDFKKLIADAECGYWSESKDTKEFCDHVKKLSVNKELRNIMGKNGRIYMEKNFNVSRSVDLLESFFKTMAQNEQNINI